jgi:hypothetical protein
MAMTFARVERKLQSCLLAVLSLTISSTCSYSSGQSPDEIKPKVSDLPLTDEQLGVYRVILSGWMSNEVTVLNLADLTEPFPQENGSTSCFKGLDMEPDHPDVVHRFRAEDLVKLSPAKLQLVSSEAQEEEVGKHDPGKAIRNGKSIDEALKDGFAHGRTWFSEVRFDKSHTHAVVFYGFHCGSLCGNGGTAILEKSNGKWKVKSQCSIWMS